VKRLFRHEPSVWVLWVICVALLVATPFALADMGVWVLMLDPELLAAIAFAGIALAGSSVRHAFVQVTRRFRG
jgi:hypothetical protein